MHAGRLSSAAVGRALARVFDITPKSGIKQVDRLLGNEQFDVAAIFQQSVPWLVAHRAEIVVSLDWTEYGAHGHSRIAVKPRDDPRSRHAAGVEDGGDEAAEATTQPCRG